jgi:hypothetical protein
VKVRVDLAVFCELLQALAFYADERNYDGYAPVECRAADDGEDGGCEYDKGRIARAALSCPVPPEATS